MNEKLQSYYTRQLIYKDTFNSILGPEIVLFELTSNNFLFYNSNIGKSSVTANLVVGDSDAVV